MDIEIIKENIQLKEDTFYYKLREKNTFDIGMYNQLIYKIIDSFNSIKEDTNRYKSSLGMWELFFLICKDLVNHQNRSDVYKIKGINEEIISKVVNDMYEIGNFISWKKEINFKDYFVS